MVPLWLRSRGGASRQDSQDGIIIRRRSRVRQQTCLLPRERYMTLCIVVAQYDQLEMALQLCLCLIAYLASRKTNILYYCDRVRGATDSISQV